MPATRTPKSIGKSSQSTVVSAETVVNNPQTTSTPIQPKKRARKAGKYRDTGAEVIAHYGSAEAYRVSVLAFAREYQRPVSPGTQEALDAAERDYISILTESLGSEEAARATLEKDAGLPPMEHFIGFVHSMATLSSWSAHTTREFVDRVFDMRARKSAKAPTHYERDQIFNAIAEWQKDGVLRSGGACQSTDVDSQDSFPADPSSPSTTASTSETPAVDFQEADLRNCVAAFLQKDSTSSGQNLADQLVKEKMWLPDLVDTTFSELCSIVPGLTVGAANRFLKFAKQWKD